MDGSVHLRLEVVPVEVPKEGRREVRAAPENLVEDRDRAYDPTLTATLGGAQTEQSDDVGGVRVEVLLDPGLVQPGARGGGIGTCVADVDQRLAQEVLRHWRSEVESERPIREHRVVIRQAVERQPPHEHEDTAAPERLAPPPNGGSQGIEAYVLARDLVAWLTAPAKGRDQPFDLDRLARRQRVDPILLAG